MVRINGWRPAGVIRESGWGIPGLLRTVSFDTHSLAGDPVYSLVAVRNLCRHDTQGSRQRSYSSDGSPAKIATSAGSRAISASALLSLFLFPYDPHTPWSGLLVAYARACQLDGF